MKTKKLFILFTMLIAGLSVNEANNANKMVIADAAENPAYLSKDWKSKHPMLQNINTLLITKDRDKIPANYWIGPVDVDTDSNNSIINAYCSSDGQKMNCVIYADAGTIYAESGENLFSGFSGLEEITFDCNFNIAESMGANNSMKSMFAYNTNLKEINGLNLLNTLFVTDMSEVFLKCSSLKSLDLSQFNLHFLSDKLKLIDLSTVNSLTEIKLPNSLDGCNIKLPSGFYVETVDPSMQGLTLARGSKELNDLASTLRYLNTCTEYMQASTLQAAYDGLNDADKITFSTLRDYDNVLLTEKLAYMVDYADYKANEASAAAETNLVLSDKTNNYLVPVIAFFSLVMISGYYFIQKKKYAK